MDAGLPVSMQQAHNGKLYVVNYGAKAKHLHNKLRHVPKR